MKTKHFTLPLLAMTLLLLYACSGPGPAATQSAPTADAQAAGTADQNTQATASAAAQASSTEAQQANLSAVSTEAQATLSAQPVPDTATLTEQEVAALVYKAISQAMTDAASAATDTSLASSDGAISSDEAKAAAQSAYKAYYEIGYAEKLIAAYNAAYGDYADEAATTLSALGDNLAAISQGLADIDATLSQGATNAGTAIDPLKAGAGNIQIKTGEAQNRAKSWSDQVTSGISKREIDTLKLPPNQVVGDHTSAVLLAYDFLDAYKAALADGKITAAELAQIGQLSANARASLIKTGEPQLQKLDGIIQGLTRNAARGELGSAGAGIKILERALPARPAKK